ncbi:hypothetical protein JCM8208_005977 [Rhodotorula glutinis]
MDLLDLPGWTDDDLDLDALSDAAEQLSDDLPALSFSSASEGSSRSPSPAPPTPSPPDLDSLDPHPVQLLAFSRSPSPLVVDQKYLGVGPGRLAVLSTSSPSRSPPHRPSPFLVPSSLERTTSPPPSGCPRLPLLPRYTSYDTAAPVERRATPTQVEMDAFFGYVDPLAPPLVEHSSGSANKAACAGCVGATRVEDAEGDRAASEDEKRIVEVGSCPSGQDKKVAEGVEALEAGHKAQEEVDEEERRYFQLAPLPEVSPKTGLPWSREERRLAIADSLERLAVSVLEQLVDAVAPEPTEQQEGGSQQLSTTLKTMQKIEIVLAKRDGENESTGKAGAQRSKTQSIKFPRRYGHGGNLRLGARELACLLKVIELVLEALKSGIVCTKRDMYYRDVNLFVKQAIVDSLVDDLAATLHVRRSELNVVATAKGLFAGDVKLVLTDGSELSSADQGALIPSGTSIDRLELGKVKWVLVVEKDAIFQTLATSSLLDDDELGAGVLLTGKGYPDLATRELLKRLSDELPSTPIFALVDSDPHGLSILSVYAHGSALQSHDAHNLVVPRLQWLGVKGTEWAALGVDRDELLPLTKADRVKALLMLKKDNLPDAWRRELEFMLHLQRKGEIQILSSTRRSTTAAENSQQEPSSSSLSSRLVDYVKKALWLALEDSEEDEEEALSVDPVEDA